MTTRPFLWVERYSQNANIESIRRKGTVKAEPLTHLDQDPPEVACVRMDREWQRICVITAQMCEILLRILEMAAAYAKENYIGVGDFILRCYNFKPNSIIQAPLCLTGPSGTGKSTLSEALKRILGPDSFIDVGSAHGPFPLKSVASLKIEGRVTLNAVLSGLCAQSLGREKAKVGQTIGAAAHYFFKSGCCLAFLDEIQFVAQSETAVTAVGKILSGVSYVGIPLVFNANYSLCSKLLQRAAPEINQRLMTSPVVMTPDSPDSVDWEELLCEMQRAVPREFEFSFVAMKTELWNYTAGLKRCLRELLVKAYRRARSAKRAQACWDDIVEAYKSAAYSASRNDIEELVAWAVTGKPSKRKNLMSPFHSTPEIIYKRHLQQIRNQKLADEVTLAATTPKEKKIIADIRRQQAGGREVNKNGRVKKQKASCAEDLLRNATTILDPR